LARSSAEKDRLPLRLRRMRATVATIAYWKLAAPYMGMAPADKCGLVIPHRQIARLFREARRASRGNLGAK
jgi:hypothetical protein